MSKRKELQILEDWIVEMNIDGFWLFGHGQVINRYSYFPGYLSFHTPARHTRDQKGVAFY